MDYAPNALGQPTRIGSYASDIRYHPNGAVAGYRLANGIVRTIEQNVRGLTSVQQDNGPAGLVAQDRYSYDANGNVIGIQDEQDAGGSRSMPWYDGLDRLRQANGPWGGGSFSYDALDNLTSSTVGGRSLIHTYDLNNRLVSMTGSQNLSIGYDANGNIASRGGQGFQFDISNRLRSAQGKASYVYDGHGRRNLVFYANGDYTHQAYTQDGKLRLAWWRSGDTRRYVYLGQQLIAEHSGDGIVYQHTDALGSPVATTNGGGAVISRTRYEPYGATAAGTNPTRIGFTGHVNDVDTGLVYMQQRYYDPIAGRFLSVDPVVTDANSGGQFGRYHYANNNPYRFVDPDGSQSWQTICTGAECASVMSELAGGYGRARKSVRDSMASAGSQLEPDGGWMSPEEELQGWVAMLDASGRTGGQPGFLSAMAAGIRLRAGSNGLGIAAKGVATIDTAAVRFTQSSVKGTFADGRTLQSTIDALRGPGGDALAKSIPPIRIFEEGGLLKTLDNRRLLTFSQAGREVPYTWATPSEVAAEAWKFTATPQQGNGWFIRVKP